MLYHHRKNVLAPSKRFFKQAILSSVWAVASIVGPLLGAYITYAISWRAVFLINIPIGLFACYCFESFQEGHERSHERFDKKGLILFVLTTLLLFLSFTTLFEKGFTVNKVSFLALGIGSAIFFVQHALSVKLPFIHLETSEKSNHCYLHFFWNYLWRMLDHLINADFSLYSRCFTKVSANSRLCDRSRIYWLGCRLIFLRFFFAKIRDSQLRHSFSLYAYAGLFLISQCIFNRFSVLLYHFQFHLRLWYRCLR